MSVEITGDDSSPSISLDEVKEANELRRRLAEALRGELPEHLREELAQHTLEGEWDKVVEMYNKFPAAHTARINDSMDTALHVATDLDEEEEVRELVNAIITHEEFVRGLVEAINDHEEGQGPPIEEGETMALGVENERGDTPLHVAASRGFAKLCECIIGPNKERLDLRSKKNKEGETPLFVAALNGSKQAFAYLLDVSRDRVTVADLIRNDGDSILHCVIRTEYFDLAVIIVHYFDSLSTRPNNAGVTPLKVLATRPSAFRSGIRYSRWKRILYYCILVEPLDAESTMKKLLRKAMRQPRSSKKLLANYTTLYDFLHFSGVIATALFGRLKTKSQTGQDQNKKNQTEGTTERGKLPLWITDEYENASKSLEKQEAGFLPPNYATIRQFIKSAYVHALGVSGVALKDVKKTKKKHQWSRQLLVALMKRPYEAFTGKGGGPPDPRFGSDVYNVLNPWKQGETSVLEPAMAESGKGTPSRKDSEKRTKPDDAKEATDEKETAFLAAAKNGIVELVVEIQSKIPSAIYNTNSTKQNVLLVAVMNRQSRVIETLRMRLRLKPQLWDNLIRASDSDGNTMLHLAAHGNDKPWWIAGSALQMMWDIKWFRYIMSIVPQRSYFRSNKDSKTAGEIFEQSHKELIKEGSEWLKDTSESCSLVAALVAGVSFATTSAVPGGTNGEGKAPLQGQPAFDAFAIASLMALCFSLTGLIIFLSILTSRREARDFRRALPVKLLLGLSSLFVSIMAMFISFCAGHFFIINHKYTTFLFPFYVATSLPVAFYALAQLPLYFDLLTAIITKVPRARDAGESF